MAVEAFIGTPELREGIFFKYLEPYECVELPGVRDVEGRRVLVMCDADGDAEIVGFYADIDAKDMDDDELADVEAALEPIAYVVKGGEIKYPVFTQEDQERRMLVVKGLGKLTLDQADDLYQAWLVEHGYIPDEIIEENGSILEENNELEKIFFSKN